MTVDNGSGERGERDEISPNPSERGDRGRFGLGNRAGRGRPKSTVTAAMRRRADPEALAEFLCSMVECRTAPVRERVRCAEILISYLDGKPVSRTVSMTVGAGQLLPADFATLDARGQERALDDLRARAVAGELAALDAPSDDDRDHDPDPHSTED